MERIPEKYLDLFQKRSFAHFATVMPDGTPQVTPVWVDYDGQYVLVNTAKGRQKTRNIERDAKVALDILDPDNPYRWLAVRGQVAEVTEEGADDHIDKLAQRYRGVAKYPNRRPGEQRIIVKIAPLRVTHNS
ncbi:MAG: PPOX class F420-dependent oxidoreductase [Anaerolineae bacterium]|nr:PPOX class F420-dependent oxidoreductase [Anaerolineae bacterium]